MILIFGKKYRRHSLGRTPHEKKVTSIGITKNESVYKLRFKKYKKKQHSNIGICLGLK